MYAQQPASVPLHIRLHILNPKVHVRRRRETELSGHRSVQLNVPSSRTVHTISLHITDMILRIALGSSLIPPLAHPRSLVPMRSASSRHTATRGTIGCRRTSYTRSVSTNPSRASWATKGKCARCGRWPVHMYVCE